MTTQIKISELPTGTPTSDDILVFVDKADGITKRADKVDFPSVNELTDLSDVTIVTPTNGQSLSFNGTQWVNSTLVAGDMILSSNQTNSGLKTFLNNTLGLRNVADTFTSFFTNTNTASRTYNLKDANGTLAFTTDITGTNSGTNTGDQTSIVGITGTIAEFNTALTDGNFATHAGTETLTNKRVTKRVETVSSSATPASNTDSYDVTKITSLATAITSMTSGLTGTPNDWDLHAWSITDNGIARAITCGASFEDGLLPLPTTTVISTPLDFLCRWNSSTSKWRRIA